MKQLWGLPTVEPDTQAVGACLSIGRKPSDRIGWPIEKDRFHVVEPKTRERKIGGKKIEYREHDVRFQAYNGADLEVRRTFYGMLCYHRERECWNPNYGMYTPPKGRGLVNPSGKRFSCTGNGLDAQRWIDDEYKTIECPGEGCPFRQGEEPPCRPRARFWFLPVWKHTQGKTIARYKPDGTVEQLLERPIMRMATQGREARDTFAGMLKVVQAQAEGVGAKIYSWFGLPFQIRLSESTGEPFAWQKEGKGRRWPDLTFTLDGDWKDWLSWQVNEFRQLAEASPMLSLGAASEAELDAEAVGAEHAAIVPTVEKPAAVMTAPEATEDVIDADEVEQAETKAPSEDPNDKRLEQWMAATGYDKRKKLVTLKLREGGLLDAGEHWYEVKNSAPWAMIEKSLAELESLKPEGGR